MKFFALSVTALVFLALGVIASACGDDGGGGLSLEEYFQQLDAIQDNADAQFATQEAGGSDQVPGPDASEEEVADFVRQGFQATVTTLTTAAAAASELDPPGEVEEAHNQLVAAVEDAVAAIQVIVDEFPEQLSSSDLENLDALLDTSEGDAAFVRLDEACLDLQTIADDNSIDVDLECEGAEE